ncbi:protein of unknown function [Georgfuchsia toluolica]|uniref:Uncharacterized protein n=1 Tax=Georgfuchsia toluolica TaxID=424218 RepID=A0A916J419_9PROT|nr:protein of unknown function [Georgfuchsia toluolica]
MTEGNPRGTEIAENFKKHLGENQKPEMVFLRVLCGLKY